MLRHSRAVIGSQHFQAAPLGRHQHVLSSFEQIRLGRTYLLAQKRIFSFNRMYGPFVSQRAGIERKNIDGEWRYL